MDAVHQYIIGTLIPDEAPQKQDPTPQQSEAPEQSAPEDQANGQ